MKQEDKIFYGKYADKLEEIRVLMMTEIQTILDSISTDPETAPAEHLKCRIKGSESLKEKLRKKNMEQTPEYALKNLSDIVGARVVTHFIGDIYTVSDLIEKSDKWQVRKIKDYIAAPKPNGYRSLHMILRYDHKYYVEIQLRTISMDTWAALEHHIHYKKTASDNDKLIIAELKRCADELASTDMSMQTIRDMIRKDL